MSELPDGWAPARIGELAGKIGSGATPKGGAKAYKLAGTPLLRSLNVHFDGVRDEGVAFLDDVQAAKLDSVQVEADDVLLNITGASIGRVAVAPERYAGARVNQHVAIIRTVDGVDPFFLSRYLASPDAQERILEENYGVTRQALTKGMIEEFPVALPPLPEQRRIVAKLDRLSARSAAARDHLARTTKLATRAKQAVLSNLLESAGATTVPLGELVEEIRYGTAKKCDYDTGATPVLRIPNLADGRIDTNDLKYADFDQKELRKLALETGDILVIRSNGSLDLVGRSSLVGEECAGYLFAGYLIRVRTDRARCDPSFLQLVMASYAARRLIERLAKSTSGVNNINSAQIASIPVPGCPLEEQHEIVQQASAAFTRIDRMTEEASRAAHLLNRLDERLLAKAFRGELVPQDPSDEPAEALLARIRETRTAGTKPTRGRRKTL